MVMLIGLTFPSFFFNFSEELKEHFGKYGEIDNVTLKSDPNTGRSRGFAFIVFKDTESLDKVRNFLNTHTHTPSNLKKE